MLSAFLWIVSVAMVPVKASPQKPFQTALHFIALCLSLYIYLGFVKFSILRNRDTFRKLIIIAMGLSVIQTSIIITATLVGNKGLYNYNSVAVAIESVVLFYAFKSVQDVKTINFKKLSRMYLYLLFFYVPTSIAMLFGNDVLKTMIPHVLIKPFVIIALFCAALIVYTWYLKIKVFKQIAAEMY